MKKVPKRYRKSPPSLLAILESVPRDPEPVDPEVILSVMQELWRSSEAADPHTLVMSISTRDRLVTLFQQHAKKEVIRRFARIRRRQQRKQNRRRN